LDASHRVKDESRIRGILQASGTSVFVAKSLNDRRNEAIVVNLVLLSHNLFLIFLESLVLLLVSISLNESRVVGNALLASEAIRTKLGLTADVVHGFRQLEISCKTTIDHRNPHKLARNVKILAIVASDRKAEDLRFVKFCLVVLVLF